MGKSIDDLPLDPAPRDDRDSDWYRFLITIDDLLATGKYDWAEASLSGIRETVERYHRVTDGQRKAVANIEASRERADGWRRRGEGFGGRWR